MGIEIIYWFAVIFILMALFVAGLLYEVGRHKEDN